MSSPKFITVLLLMAIPAAAEPRTTDEPTEKLIISERAVSDALDRAPTPMAAATQTQGQRDSLKNGAVIGAMVGAAVMGTGVGLLCKALQEPTDPSCWGSVGIGALYGAGIGVAAGVGLDALFVKGQRALQPVLIRRTSIRP